MARLPLALALALLAFTPAQAQTCKRAGTAVTCDDGRVGTFAGDAIVWPDGTRSSASPHPSVIIGNRASVQVGQGVFAGSPSGTDSVPLDNPNAANKRTCAILDGVPYCH